jgi:hypothetical protein
LTHEHSPDASLGSLARSLSRRSWSTAHVMIALVLAAAILVVGVAALVEQSDTILDRVDPQLWPYLHH